MKNIIYLISILGLSLIALSACELSDPKPEPHSKRIQWDKIPDSIVEEMTNADGMKFVGHEDLAWGKRLITISFEGGDDDVLTLIEQTAKEWTDLGGELQFSFRNSDGSFRKWTRFDSTKTSDIRVSFRTGSWGGYWSTIGSLTENVSSGHPTMNLEGLDQDLKQYLAQGTATAWKTSYEKSTILHEFGHALGLAHEHFHPKCQADMRMDAVVKDLMGPPNNWKKNKAKFNMDYAYYLKVLFDEGDISQVPITSDSVDQNSLMLYSGFPDSYFKSGKLSPCIPAGPVGFATEISSRDREYYLKQYLNIPTPF